MKIMVDFTHFSGGKLDLPWIQHEFWILDDAYLKAIIPALFEQVGLC